VDDEGSADPAMPESEQEPTADNVAEAMLPEPIPADEPIAEPAPGEGEEPPTVALEPAVGASEPVPQRLPSLVIPGRTSSAAAVTPAAAPVEGVEIEVPDAIGTAPVEPSLDDMVAHLREEPAEDPGSVGRVVPDAVEAQDGEEPEAAPEAAVSGESVETAIADAPSEPDLEIDQADLVRSSTAARLPFWIYTGVWAVFAIALGVVMWPFATGPFVEVPVYGVFVLVGAALAIAAPTLAVIAWVVTKDRGGTSERAGLVRAIMFRMSLSMIAGVSLWWAALIVLDLHRAGIL
jgi:hypothetical protein